ncbi:MAG TPA: type 4a pilus biogenesis protein PilO [Deltaproteobacteria bacterium]|nr:type 4a pilus biogenesis protein PilO [Deltaproteobacteria bacterium]
MNVIELLMRQKAIVKIVVLALILGIIVAVYWQFLYRPVMSEVKTLEPELATLKQELSAKQAIVAERPKYEAELEQTRHELVLALKQLPDKSEIPSLLETISSLGKSSGLDFILFKPRPEVTKNFYAEIPVDIKVQGSYRDVVTFFDRVSKMPRIVNMSEIAMTAPKMQEGRTSVTTTCMATTYKFIEGVTTQ